MKTRLLSLLVWALCCVVATSAQATCSPTAAKIACSDPSERAKHQALCALQEHGTQTAAELLRQPASGDPEDACARSWALRQVYQLASPHEQQCEPYLCPFGLDNADLQRDPAQTLVTVSVAFDIERVAVAHENVSDVVYLRPEAAGLAAPTLMLSLRAGDYVVQYRSTRGNAYEKNVKVGAAPMTIELGVRVKVRGLPANERVSIDGTSWQGESLLTSEDHDVGVEGAAGCQAQIDRARGTLTFPPSCQGGVRHPLSMGPQMRVDTTFSGGGSLWLLGGVLGIRAQRFTVEPRAAALLAGNAKGWAAGLAVGYRVWQPIEVLLGADVLSAYIDDAPHAGPSWGLYPGLQLRYRPSDTGVGALLSGNLVCLFDEKLSQQSKTVYASAGAGVEWRFGL